MSKTYLGIELGSTRIKAVAIDENHVPVSSGDYTWKSSYENGIWTYDLAEVWKGLKTALSGVENRESVAAMGVSAMMHGYLAFDKDWNLLVPFRTWQNTITAQAAAELTELFSFNIPQRWSIAHLYQAVLNKESHVPQIAHITTLAGYVHYMLTGVNAIGIGEASGMFPIDSEKNCYDEEMLKKFEKLTENQPWNIRDILPGVLMAGDDAGTLTESGAAILDGLLPVGVPFAPAEGDAGTGMTATNAVAPGTGNVSAGTSIFSMVVLEKSLAKVYEEIDLVTAPTGNGASAFMKDYTYHLVEGQEYSLGAHMLEVCPSLADPTVRPKIDTHHLGIGMNEKGPARLVFEGKEGDAIVVSLIDMGGRLRLIVQDIHCVKPILPMPNLPVARVMWQAMPNLTDGVECRITAGGTHHTVLSYDVTAQQMKDWARMMDIEFVHITKDTTVDALEKELFLNDLAWKLK